MSRRCGSGCGTYGPRCWLSVRSTMEVMIGSPEQFTALSSRPLVPPAPTPGRSRVPWGRPVVVAVAVVAVVASGLAGCGDSGDDTNGAPVTTVPPTAVVPTTPTEDLIDPGSGNDGLEADDEASAVVQAFMDARASGAGAEAWLTADAVEAFGPSLYDVMSSTVVGFNAADANSFEVSTEVTGLNGAPRTEILFVGPGQPVVGGATVVVRGVALN